MRGNAITSLMLELLVKSITSLQNMFLEAFLYNIKMKTAIVHFFAKTLSENSHFVHCGIIYLVKPCAYRVLSEFFICTALFHTSEVFDQVLIHASNSWDPLWQPEIYANCHNSLLRIGTTDRETAESQEKYWCYNCVRVSNYARTLKFQDGTQQSLNGAYKIRIFSW